MEKVATATEYLSRISSWVSVWGDYSQQVRPGPLARQLCQRQAECLWGGRRPGRTEGPIVPGPSIVSGLLGHVLSPR